MKNIDVVWTNIKRFQNTEFRTIKNIPYTYSVSGNSILLDNTNRRIPKSDIQKALDLSKLSISELNRINVQGPSYIYGILSDDRIDAK